MDWYRGQNLIKMNSEIRLSRRLNAKEWNVISDQDHVFPALEAGASGYQLKDIEPNQLEKVSVILLKVNNK